MGNVNLIRALHDAEQNLRASMRSIKEAEYQLEGSTDAMSLQALGVVFETYAKHLNDLRAYHAERAKGIKA